MSIRAAEVTKETKRVKRLVVICQGLSQALVPSSKQTMPAPTANEILHHTNIGDSKKPAQPLNLPRFRHRFGKVTAKQKALQINDTFVGSEVWVGGNSYDNAEADGNAIQVNSAVPDQILMNILKTWQQSK